MKKLREILREALPEIIGGLVVAAAIAIAGWLVASIGKVWAILLVATGIVIGGCVYLAFKHIPRLVEGSRRHRKPTQPPSQVIILLADFDGPERQKYRVTETVLTRLRVAVEPYDDVEIRPLRLVITEGEGSAVARAEGEKHKAAMVIWGWYGLPGKAVPLSVHFEVLRPPRYLPTLGPETRGLVRTAALADLESFTLQTRLSAEMAYLSLFVVGIARYTADDCEGAIACFSSALRQTEERVLALDQGVIYYVRGNAHAFKGDLGRAIADYDQAIALQPDYALAYYNRGLAYRDKGDLDHAIADCDQAIALKPDFAVVYLSRGLAYGNRGDLDHAIADYDQAIALKPDFAVAYLSRGLAYGNKGDLDHALADYDQAIALKPDSAEAYLSRGLAYGNKGDLGHAIADFDQAIALKPDYAVAYNNRGGAYFHKGDLDRAIADFDQAIALQPDHANAYYNRGVIYTQKGETAKAVADFRKVLDLSSDPHLRQQAEEHLRALGVR